MTTAPVRPHFGSEPRSPGTTRRRHKMKVRLRLSQPMPQFKRRPCILCSAADVAARMVDRDEQREIVGLCAACLADDPIEAVARVFERLDVADALAEIGAE